MKKYIRDAGILASLSASGIFAAAGVQAEEPVARTIEEVVVTAQRRAELQQNVPISIASLSADDLREANVQQLADIAQLTPAVRFDYNANFVQPTIRGIGTSVVTAGGSSNVGIYVDGFYSPNPLAADMELLNIESVQILKGPQGTLFGRNTTGGAMLVTTSEPVHEARAVVEASYGSFDTRIMKAYATTGLSDTVAFDIGASYKKSDGYAKNIISTGPDDPGRYENWSVRAGLRVELNDRASLLFRYTHHNVNDGTNLATGTLRQDGMDWHAGSGAEFWPFPNEGIATGYRQSSLSGDWPRPRFQLETDIFQLTADFDLGFANLTSYTQYREDDSITVYDQDGSVHPVLYSKFFILDKTFSQEFLLTSQSAGPLQWTAGLFYFDYEDTFDPIDFSLFGGPFFKIAGSSGTTRTLAGFVDFTYGLTDRLFLTLGGRYSKDEFADSWVDVVDFSTFELNRVHPRDISDNTFTPRLVLRYELDNASVYASYTQGYKAPLIDLPRPGGPGTVEPEEVDAFEVGYKYSAGPLSFNLAAWYYDYQDLQVSTYPQGLALVNNAASADIFGVEGDLNYHVTPDFDISVAAAWVTAEYDKFPDASRFAVCTDPVACGDSYGLLLTQGFDASGLRLQRAPEFTANLGARYRLDLGGGRLNLSANLYHTSKIHFDQSEQFHDNGYTLLGLRAEWVDPTETYSIALYGENVTDQKYYKQLNVNNYGATVVWGTPASWGLSVRAKF